MAEEYKYYKRENNAVWHDAEKELPEGDCPIIIWGVPLKQSHGGQDVSYMGFYDAKVKEFRALGGTSEYELNNITKVLYWAYVPFPPEDIAERAKKVFDKWKRAK